MDAKYVKSIPRCPGCDLQYLLFPKLNAGRSSMVVTCKETTKNRKYHSTLRRKALKGILGKVPDLWKKPKKEGLPTLSLKVRNHD